MVGGELMSLRLHQINHRFRAQNCYLLVAHKFQDDLRHWERVGNNNRIQFDADKEWSEIADDTSD